MNYFLAKTDPETYSVEQLAAERKTVWDGVRNPQALQAIRQMKPGDRVFVYHSMSSPAVVGLAEVSGPPQDDPKNPKLATVEFTFISKLEPPTPLSEIKQSGLFSEWTLVRHSRLSTMTAPTSFVDWMRTRYPHAKI